jgi:hypothetical protein
MKQAILREERNWTVIQVLYKNKRRRLKEKKEALEWPDEQALFREERNWTFIQTLHKHKQRRRKVK